MRQTIIITALLTSLAVALACSDDDDKLEAIGGSDSGGRVSNGGAPSGGRSNGGAAGKAGSATSGGTSAVAGTSNAGGPNLQTGGLGGASSGGASNLAGTQPAAGRPGGGAAGSSGAAGAGALLQAGNAGAGGSAGTSSQGGSAGAAAGSPNAGIAGIANAGAAGQGNSDPGAEFEVAATTICTKANPLDCANEATCLDRWKEGYTVEACRSTWRAYIDCVAALDASDLACLEGNAEPDAANSAAAMECMDEVVAHAMCVTS